MFGRSLVRSSIYKPPRAGLDFKSFGFRLNTKDSVMIRARHVDGKWSSLEAVPYGPLSLEPGATVLNYGQALFEGSKSYRTKKDRIVIFRPEKNGYRLNDGARRLCIPEVPPSMFLDAMRAAVVENADLVPEAGGGAFYLRPLLFGSGSALGVAPSEEYEFIIYGSPVGEYFSAPDGCKMKIVRDQQRSAQFGVGAVKCAGNYAPCFGAQKQAKSEGYSDVLYLNHDATRLEEIAASNIFLVTPKAIYTPSLDGTILPGVTRDSILGLLEAYKDEFQREIVLDLPVDHLWTTDATEAFCTGTAAGITPISLIDDPGAKSATFPALGPVVKRLKELLFGIMHEDIDDRFGWLHDPFKNAQK